MGIPAEIGHCHNFSLIWKNYQTNCCRKPSRYCSWFNWFDFHFEIFFPYQHSDMRILFKKLQKAECIHGVCLTLKKFAVIFKKCLTFLIFYNRCKWKWPTWRWIQSEQKLSRLCSVWRHNRQDYHSSCSRLWPLNGLVFFLRFLSILAICSSVFNPKSLHANHLVIKWKKPKTKQALGDDGFIYTWVCCNKSFWSQFISLL